jgi:hypothetical protein
MERGFWVEKELDRRFPDVGQGRTASCVYDHILRFLSGERRLRGTPPSGGNIREEKDSEKTNHLNCRSHVANEVSEDGLL